MLCLWLLFALKTRKKTEPDHEETCYAPNFEKVDGAYCFWSVRAWVGGCVRGCVTLFVPTVTFKPLKLES